MDLFAISSFLKKYIGEAEFAQSDQNKCAQLQKEWNQDKSDHLHFWNDQAGNGNSISVFQAYINY